MREEHFWYSHKMRRHLAEMARDSSSHWTASLRREYGPMVPLMERREPVSGPYKPMYAQLDDGRLVEYTECTATTETKSGWDDLVYLGPGQGRYTPLSWEEAQQLALNMAALTFPIDSLRRSSMR